MSIFHCRTSGKYTKVATIEWLMQRQQQSLSGSGEKGRRCWRGGQDQRGQVTLRDLTGLADVQSTVMGSQEAFIEIQAGGSLKGSLVGGSTVSVPGHDS